MVLLAATGEAFADEDFQVKGTSAFDVGQLSDFHLFGQTPDAAYSFVVVTNQPFEKAIRVQVAAPTPNVWDVQILTPTTTVPLQKGEHIRTDRPVGIWFSKNGGRMCVAPPTPTDHATSEGSKVITRLL